MGKKLRVGWFSFSCCEDSTIIFTELLNDYYKEWKDKIEFVSANVLQKRSEIKNLDVSFVEGAITSQEQEDKLKKIRSESKKIVAIGSCACSGTPSNQRNFFDENTKKEIEILLTRFSYAPFVKRVADVVTVDNQVNGCPMVEVMFLKVVGEYLKEFGIVS
jgi:sulfhydrogenase subunit delta